jgi:DNA-binding MarR family transcriptional regulator
MREPSILRHVSVLYRYSQMYFSKRLNPCEIGPGQYPYILRICRYPGISQDGLSEDLVIDKGTTAKAVKLLEAGGYITRKSDLEDKRIHRLVVTEKGERMKTVIDEVLEEWREILWDGFTNEEKMQAENLVKRMAANAAKGIKRTR